MRPQAWSPIRVMCWGVAITGVVGVLLAMAVGSALAVIPVIYLGAGVVMLRIFWRWRQGPFREIIHPVIARSTTTATKIGYVFLCVAINATYLFVAVVFPAYTHGKPCFCLMASSLHLLFNLTWTTLVSTAFVNIGLVATIVLICRIRYRPPTGQ